MPTNNKDYMREYMKKYRARQKPKPPESPVVVSRETLPVSHVRYVDPVFLKKLKKQGLA